MNKTIQRLILVYFLAALSSVAQAQLLTIDQLSGAAEIERNGARQRVRLNDPIIEKDTLRADPGTRLSIRIANQGFLELGAGAELIVEKLPYASFAPDLRTVLRLQRGFLRVVWNHPAQASAWPLLVRFGSQQANLIQGEYFFETATASAGDSACVATGQIDLLQSNGSAMRLQPPQCHEIGSGAPQRTAYTESQWAALRRNGVIHAPVTQIAQAAPVAENIGMRKSKVKIENAPARELLMQADTVPLSQTTTETLFGQKEPNLSQMLVEAKPAAKAEPVSAPKPAPAAIAAKPQTGGWFVQVVSATTSAEAESAAKKLRDAGFNPQVVTAEVSGRTWHRVRVGGFSSMAEARSAAGEIKAKAGFANTWIARQK